MELFELNFIISALRTDEQGNPLPAGSPPPPRQPADAVPSNPYHPFPDRYAFEFADYHFTVQQSSESQIDKALDQWRAERIRNGGDPAGIPWSRAKDFLSTIDSITEGPGDWKSATYQWNGPRIPGRTPPKWMLQRYELVYCDSRELLLDQISLPELDGHFDYVPYVEYNAKGVRVWSNLLSGTWSHNEAVLQFPFLSLLALIFH
jgi:hypothetical protein